MKAAVFFTLAICVLIILVQVTKGQEFYIESWKKGKTQIQEKKLLLKLNKNKPDYETVLPDSKGRIRYQLSVWAGRGKDNSNIIEWWVELFDVADKSRVNLLKPSNDPQQDFFTAKDQPSWLYPTSDKEIKLGIIPFQDKRVIKIENFYCIIQVKNYQFHQKNHGALKSITVEIQFVNEFNR
jgi:hypothetical protein